MTTITKWHERCKAAGRTPLNAEVDPRQLPAPSGWAYVAGPFETQAELLAAWALLTAEPAGIA